MRISRVLALVAGLAICLPAPALQAQFVSGGVGFSGDAGGSKLPYSATCTRTSVQVLANGATITQETTIRTARDSSGRFYNEQHVTMPAGADGKSREMVFYFVTDTVARTNLNWNSERKEATLFHQPEVPAAVPAPQRPSNSGQATTQAKRIVRPNQDVQVEDLGTRTIAGVNATGKRTTRVIPAGSMGNDQPLTIIDETWRSPEYGLVLLSISDDPRSGKTTQEVTDFQAGEPDPALFRVPEGYTVKDVSPKGTVAEN